MNWREELRKFIKKQRPLTEAEFKARADEIAKDVVSKRVMVPFFKPFDWNDICREQRKWKAKWKSCPSCGIKLIYSCAWHLCDRDEIIIHTRDKHELVEQGLDGDTAGLRFVDLSTLPDWKERDQS